MNSVVLPAPLGPMMPTMPAGGSENDEVVDQQAVAEALRQALDLDDGVAEALAGRDGDLEAPCRAPSASRASASSFS